MKSIISVESSRVFFLSSIVTEGASTLFKKKTTKRN